MRFIGRCARYSRTTHKYAPDAAAPHRTPQMRGIHVTGLVSWRRIFNISSVVEAPTGEVSKPMKMSIGSHENQARSSGVVATKVETQAPRILHTIHRANICGRAFLTVLAYRTPDTEETTQDWVKETQLLRTAPLLRVYLYTPLRSKKPLCVAKMCTHPLDQPADGTLLPSPPPPSFLPASPVWVWQREAAQSQICSA